MIIGYTNQLATATLTATSEDASYPLENLFHKWKKKLFKATTTTTTITITLAAEMTINSFFMLYHNTSACEVRLYHDANLLDTWTVTHDSWHVSVATVTSVQVDLTSSATIYVGSMFVGGSIDSNKEASQDMPLMSTDNPTFSSDYQVSGKEGSILRSANVSVPLLTATERKALETMFKDVGLTKPFFLDLWESSATSFEPLYGVITGSFGVQHTYDSDTVSFNFQEVN